MVVAPRGGEQPPEGGRTHVADELVELGREPQLAIAGEPVEELWHEGMEAMRADVSGLAWAARGRPPEAIRGRPMADLGPGPATGLAEPAG